MNKKTFQSRKKEPLFKRGMKTEIRPIGQKNLLLVIFNSTIMQIQNKLL